MTHVPATMRRVVIILLVVVLLIVTLGTGIASAASPPPIPKGSPSGLCNYYVRAGDTLYGLALRYGTTVNYLASVNHIANPRLIRIGQHLLVPCSPCCLPPPPPPPPGGCNCWYRIQPGDTLSRIAARYGVTSAYLASVNHIANPNRIYAGAWLRVPCRLGP
jgi:LysM repeat protein